MPEIIYTDPLGTKLEYDKEAVYPYTSYLAIYPESTNENVETVEPEYLPFQVGRIKEHGVNGCTNELMFAVLKHRLTILDEENHHPANTMVIFLLDTCIQLLEIRSNERKQGQVFDTDIPSKDIQAKIKRTTSKALNSVISRTRSGITSRLVKIKKWSEA